MALCRPKHKVDIECIYSTAVHHIDVLRVIGPHIPIRCYLASNTFCFLSFKILPLELNKLCILLLYCERLLVVPASTDKGYEGHNNCQQSY